MSQLHRAEARVAEVESNRREAILCGATRDAKRTYRRDAHRAERRCGREIVRTATDEPGDREIFAELEREDAETAARFCRACGGPCDGLGAFLEAAP